MACQGESFHRGSTRGAQFQRQQPRRPGAKAVGILTVPVARVSFMSWCQAWSKTLTSFLKSCAVLQTGSETLAKSIGSRMSHKVACRTGPAAHTLAVGGCSCAGRVFFDACGGGATSRGHSIDCNAAGTKQLSRKWRCRTSSKRRVDAFIIYAASRNQQDLSFGRIGTPSRGLRYVTPATPGFDWPDDNRP